MIELTIPATAPSLNALIRMHWTKRAKLVEQWKRFIWAARCEKLGGQAPKPLRRARVSIERRSPWLCDPDNAISSAKMVLDGLRSDNLIVDDSPEHIELTVTQCKGKQQTVIRIEALE